MRIALLAAILLSHVFVRAQDETPFILDVSQVVAGANRTETLYAYAVGKWSDAGEHVAGWSTEIHCYESFGFCEEADARYVGGQAGASLNSFDILRWDKHELIAVDSSPICVVNTLRLDFAPKKVTITMSLKGETKDPSCKDLKATTAFLGGAIHEIKENTKKRK
jgi:hypothetical protein